MYYIRTEGAAYKSRRGDISIPEVKPVEKIELVAPRGTTASFQLALKCDTEWLVSVSEAPASHWSGHVETLRISAQSELPTSLAIEGYIEDDARVETADMLETVSYKSVPKLTEQAVWVTAEVPRDAEPGIYSGKLTLRRHKGFEREEIVAEIEFSVEAASVVMPENGENGFHLDLWQHPSNIARKHETPLWSDAHFEVLERYVESLAKLGQKAVTVIASDMAWSGQSCYKTTSYPSDMFEYSMIGVEKLADGSIKCDFTACDRYVELCRRHGIKDEIEIFGLIGIWTDPAFGFGPVVVDLTGEYDDGVRVRAKNPDGSFDYLRTKEEMGAYFAAIEEHFASRGELDVVRVVADEPRDPEQYLRRRAFLGRHAPRFKFKAAVGDYHFVASAADKISDFVPILPGICSDPEKMFEIKDKLDARFLWYVCCGPKMPNTYISSALVESYAIGILTAYMRFDGFLRWNYTVWPENPRERMSFRAPGWTAGDTNFVYPSRDGRPLLTTRWYALRHGIELCWMLREAERRFGREAVEPLYAKVLRSPELRRFNETENFEDVMSGDPKDYESVDKQLIAMLK